MPTLGHHSRIPLEFGVLRITNLAASHVGVNNKLPDLVAGDTHADIRKNSMGILQFRFAPLLPHDPSVLPEASDIEGLVYARQNKEG